MYRIATANVLILTLICLMPGSVASAEGLTAGAARVSIVPPFPTHMGGFGDRMETFKDAKDELYARALALHDGERAVIIIGSDLMAIDGQLVQRAREEITKRTRESHHDFVRAQPLRAVVLPESAQGHFRVAVGRFSRGAIRGCRHLRI